MGEGGLADQTARREGGTAQAAVESMRSRIPLGRLGTEFEVAGAIVFLCSEPASFITCAAWSVADGYVPGFP